MFSSQTSHFFIICLDSVCCDGGKKVENPPAEATPDFAYKPCKGFQAAVIEESQKEEEAGLALCTFPVPCSGGLFAADVFVQEDRVLRF